MEAKCVKEVFEALDAVERAAAAWKRAAAGAEIAQAITKIGAAREFALKAARPQAAAEKAEAPAAGKH